MLEQNETVYKHINDFINVYKIFDTEFLENLKREAINFFRSIENSFDEEKIKKFKNLIYDIITYRLPYTFEFQNYFRTISFAFDIVFTKK